MKKCKHCGRNVQMTHYCSVIEKDVDYDDDSFFISAAIGYATDSAIIGGIVGGDILGGILGDALNDDDTWTFLPFEARRANERRGDSGSFDGGD